MNMNVNKYELYIYVNVKIIKDIKNLSRLKKEIDDTII